MKKNVGGTWRRTRGLGIVRLPRVVLLAAVLTISAGIPLGIPGPASAQQPPSDLTPLVVTGHKADLPPTATSVQGGTILNGVRDWAFFLTNNSQLQVTNAAVSVESGYDPSLINFSLNGNPVSAFPVSATQASVAPREIGAIHAGLESDIPVSFSLGYDSTRAVSPLVIPAGGAQQTVTITLNLTDSRYALAPDAIVEFNIHVSSLNHRFSVVSLTGPDNLNQGETLQTDATGWSLSSPLLNKQYTFTAVINVPNPSGIPFEYQPVVGISGTRSTFLSCGICSTGTTDTIADPTLDGNVLGSGVATFSVADTGHTWTWASTHGDAYNVFYGEEVTSTPAVTGVSPASGPLTGGTSVTISGSGFTAATAVDFGPAAAPAFTVNSDTSITATSPAATSVGPVDVTVTTPAGTSATSSADQFTYTYPFTGYQPPVANPPTLNQVNGGQAIPMKFSLGGNYGLNIIAPGYPAATRISCSAGTAVNSGTLTDTAGGSGLQYDSSTGTYTYVWKTSKSWAGTCQQFDLRLNDGTDHTADFQFK